jgi:hypothetical protein
MTTGSDPVARPLAPTADPLALVLAGSAWICSVARAAAVGRLLNRGPGGRF